MYLITTTKTKDLIGLHSSQGCYGVSERKKEEGVSIYKTSTSLKKHYTYVRKYVQKYIIINGQNFSTAQRSNKNMLYKRILV